MSVTPMFSNTCNLYKNKMPKLTSDLFDFLDEMMLSFVLMKFETVVLKDYAVI